MSHYGFNLYISDDNIESFSSSCGLCIVLWSIAIFCLFEIVLFLHIIVTIAIIIIIISCKMLHSFGIQVLCKIYVL